METHLKIRVSRARWFPAGVFFMFLAVATGFSAGNGVVAAQCYGWAL